MTICNNSIQIICKNIILQTTSIWSYCWKPGYRKKIHKIVSCILKQFLRKWIVPCLLRKDNKYFSLELMNMVQRTPGRKWKIRVLSSVSLLCTFVTEKKSLNLCDTTKWIRALGLVTHKPQGKNLQLTRRVFSQLHGRCPKRTMGHCGNLSYNGMSCLLHVSPPNKGNPRPALSCEVKGQNETILQSILLSKAPTRVPFLHNVTVHILNITLLHGALNFSVYAHS